MRPTRSDWLTASACAAWVIGFDAWRGPAGVVVGLLTALVLLFRRRPDLAAVGVLALILLIWTLESPVQSAAMLAPGVACMYALGRYAPMYRGPIWIAVFDVVLSVRAGWRVTDFLFGIVLFGGPWIFGRLVRCRTDGALTAQDSLAEQARRDPAALAAAVVAAERSRLAAEVVAVVRTAVNGMRDAAVRARDDLDAVALASIQDTGRSAIAELRRLLGLLRQDEPRPAAVPHPDRRGRLVDGATAAVLAVLMNVEALLRGAALGWLPALLSTVLAGTVILRRRDPALACVAATAVTAAAIAVGAPLMQGIGTGVVMVLLAWSVGTEGSRGGWAALAALLVVDVADVHQSPAGTLAVDIVAVALGALSGHLWAERNRVERAALDNAAALQAASDEHIERAVKAERLQVARELHDVASHAVGVMVLQAAAAQALRGRDDVAAREALAEVEQAGETALAELTVLARVLAAPPDQHAPDIDASVGPGLEALIDRVRAGGVAVTAQMEELPDADPAVRLAVHRMVQETLTNVLRHAPGSAVDVSVRVTGDPGVDTVQVTVRNNRTRLVTPSTGSGFGLVGLAERVRALGGDLAAGPDTAGGFAVQARIPLHPSPQQPADTPAVREMTK